ncbi:Glucosamine-6-phosphate isomerase (Glucosamine-6-phosphate deaminase) (GNPDA) (GlcN6P deaminase), partial [Coemansia sp. RSA 1797]
LIKNAPVKTNDTPKFVYRGILLDTSRNFYHVDSILRTLDAMSNNKLNVLHWHIVDAFSWPVESKVHSELTEKGAYSTDILYPYEEIKIINYAKSRAIRVMPEFNMPGNTFIVSDAHPEIMSCLNKQPNWDKFGPEPPSGQLNIADLRGSFAFDVITEYSRLFVDLGFHMGGGSLNLDWWKEDPVIELYVCDHPGESIESLVKGWFNQTVGKIQEMGKVPFAREDSMLNFGYETKNTTIVEAWVSEDSARLLTKVTVRLLLPGTDTTSIAVMARGCQTLRAARGATRTRAGRKSTATIREQKLLIQQSKSLF